MSSFGHDDYEEMSGHGSFLITGIWISILSVSGQFNLRIGTDIEPSPNLLNVPAVSVVAALE